MNTPVLPTQLNDGKNILKAFGAPPRGPPTLSMSIRSQSHEFCVNCSSALYKNQCICLQTVYCLVLPALRLCELPAVRFACCELTHMVCLLQRAFSVCVMCWGFIHLITCRLCSFISLLYNGPSYQMQVRVHLLCSRCTFGWPPVSPLLSQMELVGVFLSTSPGAQVQGFL